MENHHRKYPSVMAELFGVIAREGSVFAIRKLDMRNVKAEVSTMPMRSAAHGFLFITGGEAMLEAGDMPCYLHAGECIVMPAGQPFSVLYFKDCTGYMGVFDTEYAEGIGAGRNIMQSFSVLRRWDGCKVGFGQGDHITHIMERLCFESAAGGNRNIIRAYLAAFLTEIEEALASDPRGREPFNTGNELCNRYVELVFKYHNHAIPLSEYAAQLHISKDYLHKIVRLHTGRTPLRWIAEAVLMEAKTLLSHTSKPVNEIADAVGVSDPSYFARFFKKYTGYTPLEYRNKCRKC